MIKYILMTALLAHGGTAVLASKAKQNFTRNLETAHYSAIEEGKQPDLNELHYPKRPGKKDRG